MHCKDCGEKLTLRFLENEGLVPYCDKCETFKFPLFPVAVSMTVVNRAENQILLARHAGDEDFTLFAGYVKKGETAERAIPREIREETKLTAIKWKYLCSRFHEAKNLLMLGFVVTVENGEIALNEEIEDAHWCDFDEAKELIRKNSTAEYFLTTALAELNKKK